MTAERWRPVVGFANTYEVSDHGDRVQHGTSPAGEKNGRALIEARDVAFILEEYARGVSQRALGEYFGLSKQAIGRIVRRETWKGASQ